MAERHYKNFPKNVANLQFLFTQAEPPLTTVGGGGRYGLPFPPPLRPPLPLLF